MDRIKSRTLDGKQNPEYARQYYIKNKERIAERNKELYKQRRNTPEGLVEQRRKSLEATKRYRERHPERVRESRKRLYINYKKRVFDMLGGAKCRNCGCDELSFLEINHKNGGGSKEIRKYGNRIYDMILNGKLNPNNYEVLCRVCNALHYLELKDKRKANYYKVRWEDYTGKKAELIVQGS